MYSGVFQRPIVTVELAIELLILPGTQTLPGERNLRLGIDVIVNAINIRDHHLKSLP